MKTHPRSLPKSWRNYQTKLQAIDEPPRFRWRLALIGVAAAGVLGALLGWAWP